MAHKLSKEEHAAKKAILKFKRDREAALRAANKTNGTNENALLRKKAEGNG